MKFICELLEADKPTRNGRIYPKEILEKAIENFQEKIQQKTSFVSADFWNWPLPLEKICGCITELKLNEEGKMEVEVEFLDTPMGKNINLSHEKYKIGPVGFGTLNENIIQDDYIIRAFTFHKKETT